MSKIVRQYSSVVLRMYHFSSSNKIDYTKKNNSKLLYLSNLNSSILMQNHGFSGISPPLITNINYEQLNKFIAQNDSLIIDVRTKKELAATGILPNSINIPLDELSAAFEMKPNAFFEKYNTSKPNKELSIIFSCAKGIRSLKASQYAADLGYKNVYNYSEGWFGWEKHK